MTRPDGTVEEGQWMDAKLNGEAIITKPDGTTVTGMFKDGV
jgi:hypothetical protein